MGTGDIKSAADSATLSLSVTSTRATPRPSPRTFTKDGKAPAQFTDFRKVLERKDVNIIVQATPDHWHTLINLAAASAKKDIYGEKPLTLTIDEGKHLVKAVRKEGIILQTGTQQRSHKLFRLACELVRNGRIGKLKTVIGVRAGGTPRGSVHARAGAAGIPLGHVARPGAEGRLPEGALPRHVPLVVGLLGRTGHRLGRASQRHRALGDRPRRPDLR